MMGLKSIFRHHVLALAESGVTSRQLAARFGMTTDRAFAILRYYAQTGEIVAIRGQRSPRTGSYVTFKLP